MKAARLFGPGDLRVEDVPDPEPGPGEVVLAVRSALTCGTDVKMLRRGHPAIGSYPVPMGHEFAGEIMSIGREVHAFQPGDQVFCADSAPCGGCYQCERGRFSLCESLEYLFGGFAEYLLVPARIVATNMHVLPDRLQMTIAPMAEPLACAIHAVETGGIAAGESAVVVGAGSLGLMLCAVLTARGADVLVLDPNEARLERAARFGAAGTGLATRGRTDVEVVRSRTGGRGAEHVFEAVGRPEAWEQAIAMACPGGMVTLFGGCPRGTQVRVPTHRVHYEQVTLRGSYHHCPQYVRSALDLLTEGSHPWQELCGPRIGLHELADALEGRLGEAGVKYVVIPG